VTTPAATPLQRTSRDPEVMRSRLEAWLRGATGAADATVTDLRGTDTNGMSSDTLLFRAGWTDADGVTHDDPLVARVAPDAADVPVFPTYDMPGQFETIRLVHELADVPVPTPRWCAPDAAHIGAPFFVMSRVDGVVPPDVLPYPFGDNWLYDADATDQRTLQDATVDAIAGLHAIDDAPGRFAFLEYDVPGSTHLRRHVEHTHALWEFVKAQGAASPLVEHAFGWLDDHWPADEGDPVLSWGDSRIGNVIYRDFRPVALLDWEMAGLGPRELDVGWLVCAHMVFQHLTDMLGLPGMPEFMQRDAVCARYAERAGHEPRDLDFYLAYSAVIWAIVLTRTGQRQVHFGERTMPADTEEFIFHRALLDQLTSS
jgi:aminoglycoside phosphotransferase (APT) family kinase protein